MLDVKNGSLFRSTVQLRDVALLLLEYDVPIDTIDQYRLRLQFGSLHFYDPVNNSHSGGYYCARTRTITLETGICIPQPSRDGYDLFLISFRPRVLAKRLLHECSHLIDTETRHPKLRQARTTPRPHYRRAQRSGRTAYEALPEEERARRFAREQLSRFPTLVTLSRTRGIEYVESKRLRTRLLGLLEDYQQDVTHRSLIAKVPRSRFPLHYFSACLEALLVDFHERGKELDEQLESEIGHNLRTFLGDVHGTEYESRYWKIYRKICRVCRHTWILEAVSLG